MSLTHARVVLDGKKVASMDDFYDALASQLALPDHFGRNLDALWDVLTGDVEGPLEIVWQHAVDSQQGMGDRFHAVVALLLEAAKERPDITVKLL